MGKSAGENETAKNVVISLGRCKFPGKPGLSFTEFAWKPEPTAAGARDQPLEIVSAIAKPLVPTILCQTSGFGHLFHCIPPNLRVVVTQLWKAAQEESQLGYGTARRMHGNLLLKKIISKNNKNACCDSKVFPVQCEQQHLRRTLSIMGPNKTAFSSVHHQGPDAAPPAQPQPCLGLPLRGEDADAACQPVICSWQWVPHLKMPKMLPCRMPSAFQKRDQNVSHLKNNPTGIQYLRENFQPL